MTSTTRATIASYRPASFSVEVADFARGAVSACSPKSPARAKALLFATGKLGQFCSSVGLELTGALLKDSVIERFIAVGCSRCSAATRRTLRTNLRFVQKALLSGEPRPAALPRERSKAPYSEEEIASYLSLADAQPSVARRHRLGALISLGAGAGLMGADLRSVTGRHVAARSGGVVVSVTGRRRPRVVPVLSRYHDRLLRAASRAGEAYLIGGVEPGRANVTDRLVRAALCTSDLPRLDTGRLRATWLVAMAKEIGLRAFMDAAGITCSQRLGDLVAGLPSPSEEEAVALLKGRR